jgi:transcriptional regulator with XRE-family HTH domain
LAPEEIRALRKELACTARELADTLGVEQAVVMAWERAELFPTKAHVDGMAQLRTKGPAAIVRKAKASVDPFKVLAHPQLWLLVRKLAAHKKLRDEVARLAERYPDPAEDEPGA